MRASGVRGLLIYCSDYRCSHWTAISGDRWPDDVRLSDLEPRFTCQGTRGQGPPVASTPNLPVFPQIKRAWAAAVLNLVKP